MLPGFSFPASNGLNDRDVTQEQILFTILNIRSQQNLLHALLNQQPMKLNSAFQTPLHQNSTPSQSSQQETASNSSASPQITQPERRSFQQTANKIQLPSLLNFGFMGQFLPFAFPAQMPIPTVKQEDRSEGLGLVSQTDSEPARVETSDKITVKREEAEFQIKTQKDVESSESDSQSLPEKVSMSKKIKKNEKSVNTCGHPERKHYAKGLCNNCYHKFGRVGKPDLCEHDVLYAKGLCQKCYLVKYNQQKAHNIKKKKKTKGGYRAKGGY